MSDIRLFSRKLRYLFQACLFVTPLFTLGYWLLLEDALQLAINPFSVPVGHITLNPLSKGLGFIVSLLPTAVVMMLFYHLTSLFKNYQHGQIFSHENVLHFAKLGKYLFALACVNFVAHGLMSLALSFQNPPGERFFMLSLGTPQILPILVGLVIMGISYVMKEAMMLEEEQRYTI